MMETETELREIHHVLLRDTTEEDYFSIGQHVSFRNILLSLPLGVIIIILSVDEIQEVYP